MHSASESLNGTQIRGQVRHIKKINVAGKESFILARNNDSTDGYTVFRISVIISLCLFTSKKLMTVFPEDRLLLSPCTTTANFPFRSEV